jgi:hypothetical protein
MAGARSFVVLVAEKTVKPRVDLEFAYLETTRLNPALRPFVPVDGSATTFQPPGQTLLRLRCALNL